MALPNSWSDANAVPTSQHLGSSQRGRPRLDPFLEPEDKLRRDRVLAFRRAAIPIETAGVGLIVAIFQPGLKALHPLVARGERHLPQILRGARAGAIGAIFVLKIFR